NSDSDGSVAGDHPLSMSPDPGRISILQGPTELLRRLQDGFGPADPGNHGFRITVSESDQGRRVDPKELAAEWLDEYSAPKSFKTKIFLKKPRRSPNTRTRVLICRNCHFKDEPHAF